MDGKADRDAANRLAIAPEPGPVDDGYTNLLIEVLHRGQLAVWVADNADAQYAIRHWSKGAESLYGFTRAEAIGKNYVDLFVNPKEQAEAYDTHRRIVEDDEEFGWNYAAYDISKDGNVHTVLGNSFRVWDPAFDRYLYAEIGIDISKFGPLSQQIHRTQLLALIGGGARQQLKIVRGIEVLNEAIASLSQPDERGLDRVVHAVRGGIQAMLLTDALCRIWMIDDAETPRLAPGSDELPGIPRIAEIELIQKAMLSQTVETIVDGDYLISDCDGGYYRSAIASPLHIGNEVRGILIVFFRAANGLPEDDRDLIPPFSSYAAVALVMAGLAREQQRRRYEETERIRHAIMQSVLHTVGNEAGLAKLAADSLCGELERQSELSGPALRHIEQVRSSVDRLGQIMSELIHLNVSVSEQGNLNLREAVRIVTRTIERDYYDKVVVSHDIRDAICVQASEYLLREAVGNLVHNAVQAMIAADGGGELRLSASTTERDWNGQRRTVVMLDIEDSGPGVQPDFRKRIWDSGFTTRGDGHGHGLFYTRGLVGMLGGAVSLIEGPSELGGACFRMFLVAAPAAR